MKINYLIPPRTYDFFRQMIPRLERAGHEVTVNDWEGASKYDLCLVACLPATFQEAGFPEPAGDTVKLPPRRTILWHFDRFSFIDYTAAPWDWVFHLAAKAIDNWSASHETARLIKAATEIESYVMPVWVDPAELVGRPEKVNQLGTVMCSAGPYQFWKRIEWVRRACDLLCLECYVTSQSVLERSVYLDMLASGLMYVMAAFEETNGTIPAMEAAAMGKPLVISDLPGCRETFGGWPHYFKPWDFNDFLRSMKKAVADRHCHDGGPLADRITRLFSIEVVADRMIRRIHQAVRSPQYRMRESA